MEPHPDFLIIGAQKCGTTWLHRSLEQHPSIRMPPGKDGGFFCYRSTRTTSATEEYASQFFREPHERIAGESTAAYFWTRSGSMWARQPEGFEEDIPRRIRETLGAETKLLLCLRNPVERAVSAWLHHVAQGTLGLETPLLGVGRALGIIDMGFYSRHLENWLRHFPLENFYIMVIEDDIVHKPLTTLRKVYDFLGVSDSAGLVQPTQRVYPGTPRFIDSSGVHGVGMDDKKRPLVDRPTLDRLVEIYREDVHTLGDILGRDIVRLWRF